MYVAILEEDIIVFFMLMLVSTLLTVPQVTESTAWSQCWGIMGKATAYGVGIPFGHCFQSQMLRLQFSSLLVHLGKP